MISSQIVEIYMTNKKKKNSQYYNFIFVMQNYF